MKAGSWLNLLVGLWLLLSPVTVTLNKTFVKNNIIVGVLVLTVALMSLGAARDNHTPAWINLAIGLWLFVSAWLFGAATMTAIWNNAIAGVLIVMFALVRMASLQLSARPMA